MILQELQEKLEPLAAKVCESLNIDLMELKVTGHPNDLFIQITADKPSGGITIEDCAILNKTFVSVIEKEHILSPESFSLEVSSPGLDRPLVDRKDFLRFIGQELHFWLKEPVVGKKEVQGVLTEVGETTLTMEGTTRLVLDLSSVIKGRLVL